MGAGGIAGGPDAPPANLKVRFFVPQPSLALLPIGRQLTIRCDGCAAEIAATVSYVADRARVHPPVIYSNEIAPSSFS
jgi:HlyD family secretion protein